MSVPIINRPASVLARALDAVRGGYAARKIAVDASLESTSASYRLPTLDLTEAGAVQIRGQVEVGKRAGTQVRLVPAPSIEEASSINGVAVSEFSIEAGCVVMGADCSVAEGKDIEAATVLAALDFAEVVKRCLTAGQGSGQELCVHGHAGAFRVISATAEHELQLRNKNGAVIGVAMLVTVTFGMHKGL